MSIHRPCFLILRKFKSYCRIKPFSFSRWFSLSTSNGTGLQVNSKTGINGPNWGFGRERGRRFGRLGGDFRWISYISVADGFGYGTSRKSATEVGYIRKLHRGIQNNLPSTDQPPNFSISSAEVGSSCYAKLPSTTKENDRVGKKRFLHNWLKDKTAVKKIQVWNRTNASQPVLTRLKGLLASLGVQKSRKRTLKVLKIAPRVLKKPTKENSTFSREIQELHVQNDMAISTTAKDKNSKIKVYAKGIIEKSESPNTRKERGFNNWNLLTPRPLYNCKNRKLPVIKQKRKCKPALRESVLKVMKKENIEDDVVNGKEHVQALTRLLNTNKRMEMKAGQRRRPSYLSLHNLQASIKKHVQRKKDKVKSNKGRSGPDTGYPIADIKLRNRLETNYYSRRNKMERLNSLKLKNRGMPEMQKKIYFKSKQITDAPIMIKRIEKQVHRHSSQQNKSKEEYKNKITIRKESNAKHLHSAGQVEEPNKFETNAAKGLVVVEGRNADSEARLKKLLERIQEISASLEIPSTLEKTPKERNEILESPPVKKIPSPPRNSENEMRDKRVTPHPPPSNKTDNTTRSYIKTTKKEFKLSPTRYPKKATLDNLDIKKSPYETQILTTLDNKKDEHKLIDYKKERLTNMKTSTKNLEKTRPCNATPSLNRTAKKKGEMESDKFSKTLSQLKKSVRVLRNNKLSNSNGGKNDFLPIYSSKQKTKKMLTKPDEKVTSTSSKSEKEMPKSIPNQEKVPEKESTVPSSKPLTLFEGFAKKSDKVICKKQESLTNIIKNLNEKEIKIKVVAKDNENSTQIGITKEENKEDVKGVREISMEQTGSKLPLKADKTTPFELSLIKPNKKQETATLKNVLQREWLESPKKPDITPVPDRPNDPHKAIKLKPPPNRPDEAKRTTTKNEKDSVSHKIKISLRGETAKIKEKLCKQIESENANGENTKIPNNLRKLIRRNKIRLSSTGPPQLWSRKEKPITEKNSPPSLVLNTSTDHKSSKVDGKPNNQSRSLSAYIASKSQLQFPISSCVFLSSSLDKSRKSARLFPKSTFNHSIISLSGSNKLDAKKTKKHQDAISTNSNQNNHFKIEQKILLLEGKSDSSSIKSLPKTKNSSVPKLNCLVTVKEKDPNNNEKLFSNIESSSFVMNNILENRKNLFFSNFMGSFSNLPEKYIEFNKGQKHFTLSTMNSTKPALTDSSTSNKKRPSENESPSLSQIQELLYIEEKGKIELTDEMLPLNDDSLLNTNFLYIPSSEPVILNGYDLDDGNKKICHSNVDVSYNTFPFMEYCQGFLTKLNETANFRISKSEKSIKRCLNEDMLNCIEVFPNYCFGHDSGNLLSQFEISPDKCKLSKEPDLFKNISSESSNNVLLNLLPVIEEQFKDKTECESRSKERNFVKQIRRISRSMRNQKLIKSNKIRKFKQSPKLIKKNEKNNKICQGYKRSRVRPIPTELHIDDGFHSSFLNKKINRKIQPKLTSHNFDKNMQRKKIESSNQQTSSIKPLNLKREPLAKTSLKDFSFIKLKTFQTKDKKSEISGNHEIEVKRNKRPESSSKFRHHLIPVSKRKTDCLTGDHLNFKKTPENNNSCLSRDNKEKHILLELGFKNGMSDAYISKKLSNMKKKNNTTNKETEKVVVEKFKKEKKSDAFSAEIMDSINEASSKSFVDLAPSPSSTFSRIIRKISKEIFTKEKQEFTKRQIMEISNDKSYKSCFHNNNKKVSFISTPKKTESSVDIDRPNSNYDNCHKIISGCKNMTTPETQYLPSENKKTGKTYSITKLKYLLDRDLDGGDTIVKAKWKQNWKQNGRQHPSRSFSEKQGENCID